MFDPVSSEVADWLRPVAPSGKYPMLTNLDGSVFPLLPHPVIASLAPNDRTRYEMLLRGYDFDHENTTDYFSQWRRFRDRCPEPGCFEQKFDTHDKCIRHLPIEAFESPEQTVRRRSLKAKLRMAELLEIAVDELEKILKLAPEEIPPAVRLKAIDTLMDRAHLPRQTAQSVAMSGEVDVNHRVEAAKIVQSRLDRLAGSLVDAELRGIEMASADEESTGISLISGELVESSSPGEVLDVESDPEGPFGL